MGSESNDSPFYENLRSAHGVLMIIAWMFISQFAEVIAWWCRCKTGHSTMYFKMVSPAYFNAHRGLMSLAFCLGVVAMALIFSADGNDAFFGHSERGRHAQYGVALMLAVFFQIALRVAFPGEKSKIWHRILGRLIELWAFFCVMTGFKRANDQGQSDDSNLVYVMFGVWYGLKVLIWLFWLVMHKTGRANMQPLEEGEVTPAHKTAEMVSINP